MPDPMELAAFTGGSEAETPAFGLPSPDGTIEDDALRTKAFVDSVETAVTEQRLRAAASADSMRTKASELVNKTVGEKEMTDDTMTNNKPANPGNPPDDVMQIDPREVQYVMQSALSQANDLNTKVSVLSGRVKFYEDYINNLHAALERAEIPVNLLLRGEITKYVATMPPATEGDKTA